MKCKDIPTEPILELVWDTNNRDRWANNALEDEGDVRRAMPGGLDIPWKLALAKMNSLIRRGLVDGCVCGCRGDYIVTLLGCEAIGRGKHRRFHGDETI